MKRRSFIAALAASAIAAPRVAVAHTPFSGILPKVPACDPRVVLLVGADTAIIDESCYHRTLTAFGNAARDTGTTQFGAGALAFDGAGDYVQAAVDNGAFVFNLVDYTVEGWFNFSTKQTNQWLMGHVRYDVNFIQSSWRFEITSTGFLRFLTDTAVTPTITQAAFTPTLGQWYHIAFSAVSATHTGRLFVDGVKIAENTSILTSMNNTAAGANNGLIIGAAGTANNFPALDFSGYMDELRITRGVAWYTANFTPPPTAFPRVT